VVFQNPNHQLLASTVAEELALGPRHQGLPATEIERRVKDVAESLGLTPVLGVHPYRLGMAERKRVTIGAVLAMATPVLILDEPTSGHDQANREAVAARLRVTAALGSAVLVITHDLAFAEQVAHRLVVLRDGRVVASGATPEMLGDTEGLARAGLESPPLHRLRAALRAKPDDLAAGSPG
jgi:energy-coupling factor transport system ATP-binding protein